MPFNRLGDPGSVGGQSLLGMGKLRDLMLACEQTGVKLRFWPFDGLDILGPEYTHAHVCVEPYPSALRPAGVPQSDENDALHSAHAVQFADAGGRLWELLDLRALADPDKKTAAFEGWILGSRPNTQRR